MFSNTPIDSPGSMTTMLSLIAGYPVDELARWKVALNIYTWPNNCPVPCPAGFLDASEEERMRLASPLWQCLNMQVSNEAFTRAWWIYELGRTETAWAEWWDATGEAFCRELDAVHG
jgi:hypothetical protein